MSGVIANTDPLHHAKLQVLLVYEYVTYYTFELKWGLGD